jgi:hypothetical protein
MAAVSPLSIGHDQLPMDAKPRSTLSRLSAPAPDRQGIAQPPLIAVIDHLFDNSSEVLLIAS